LLHLARRGAAARAPRALPGERQEGRRALLPGEARGRRLRPRAQPQGRAHPGGARAGAAPRRARVARGAGRGVQRHGEGVPGSRRLDDAHQREAGRGALLQVIRAEEGVMEFEALDTESPDSAVQDGWRELIKPKRLEVDEKSLTPTYGKFFGEPFERGYGTTIGNALRRVLLSSLQGAAIVALRVKGVLHEFSTVPAVRNKREDDPVGTVPIDAIFSPIVKVNFMVTNARVGQRTDYDRLALEVYSDGSVRPEDAVAHAARTLQQQLAIFINFEEEP